ncbi:uncharacterized protein N0V96_008946 [Colletotrichum fioriniae]|uniref:uncharacterized protein n=1 Tax=Colletotrichum fioriniae TaxID=710243 RepID=UPI0032DB5091|nr:hypothetical protein N0V96_008946 [Colletotrichum fioriniae]
MALLSTRDEDENALLGHRWPEQSYFQARGSFTAKGIATGTAAQLQTEPFVPFSLSPEIPLATLDYGAERAGYPIFEVSALSAPAQIEVKYTEHYDGLDHPFGDGPYTFSNQLSNSFRVETFNITSVGRVQSPLIQGGQKWQSIRLLTNGTVSFSSVGFEATIDTIEPEELPGQFESDDVILNEVWKLGARAATAACFDKGTQKTIWEGGVIAGNGYTMLLTGELPESSTFANVNKTLTPPNTISLAYGPDFVNQTTLTSYLLDVFDVPFTVKENEWYRIKASMAPTGHLAVSINDTQILNISRSDYPWALSSGTVSYSGSPDFSGSFGFGAYQDQAAYFKNVHVYDTANGSTLYSNTLTGCSEDILAEYGTQANGEAACLDGPKRDRLIWLGDFYHTARIIATSTSKTEQARGTLQLLLDSQIANGQMNISPNLGYDLASVADALAPAESFGLQDYQLLGLMAFNDHVRLTNDLDWARSTWPRWQRVLDWLLPQINSTTGLLTFDGGFAFTGPADGGSAIGCEAVQTLNGAGDVADALNDTASATRYRVAATSLATAINERLWNKEAGAYGLSVADLDGISVAATAFCITSGVANATRASRSLAAVSRLKLGPGYKDTSAVSSNDSSVNISPNTNGFLLEALFVGNETKAAKELMESLWGAMLPGETTPGQNRSAVGASWEYVNAATQQPGLGLFTSLSHPWGGAATYVLTEWAAGLRAATGVDGFGYRNWVVSPASGVEMGLKRASAKVVTAFGGELSVEWRVRDCDIGVTIRAPVGTQGRFVYGNESIALHGRSQYQFTVDASLDNGFV